MAPDITPVDPKLAIAGLLSDHWTDASVTSDYAARYADIGFEWVIDDHFDADRWVHTGWFDQSSSNPQIGVTFQDGDPGTETGFDATTGDGGKSSLVANTANIDVWVQGDRSLTGGVNPKKYAWQLQLRTQLVLLDHAPMGDHPWNSMGIGAVTSPEEPDDTPIGARWRIPVLFSDTKST